MTTIYLVRHSEPFKKHRGIEEVHESILFSNIKSPLSIEGEKLAEKISINSEFENLDAVWSSDYVRAMSTAKYFAAKNNLKVDVSEQLCERKHGIDSWDELPENFEMKQFQDENFKIGNGESRRDTKIRMKTALNKILNDYKDKRVLIVGHSTAITYLLSQWCDVQYLAPYKYNDKEFFDGNWHYCETFKLEIDEKHELKTIKNIKFDV